MINRFFNDPTYCKIYNLNYLPIPGIKLQVINNLLGAIGYNNRNIIIFPLFQNVLREFCIEN